MPSRRLVSAAVTLFAAASACGAADITSGYSFEEVADGRDIHEGIYGSASDGEFDEWRLHLGTAPNLDRIQLKSKLNGAPYPGDPAIETDKVVSEPTFSPQIGLQWVLGDYERADQGWFYTLGLEYTFRQYRILYALGTNSSELTLHTLAARLGMGYGWYLSERFRFEFEPFVSAGVMWNELDLLDLSVPQPENRSSTGPVIEGGARASLLWHPAATQTWHLGAAVDYRSGYAQTTFHDSGDAGTLDSEVRLWWYGIGASVFYGTRF